MGKNILSLIFLSFLAACSPRATQVKFENREAIYIPVEIAGKTYPFLFDTGATTTIFSDELTKELDEYLQVKKEDSIKILNIYRQNHQDIPHRNYEEIPMKIGAISIKGSFASSPQSNSNIIGMNIISQLHWLFNLKDSTLLVSKKSIHLKMEELQHINLTYFSNDVPMLVHLWLNDSIGKFFVFDTGYHINDDQVTENEVNIGACELSIEITPGDPNQVVKKLGNIGGKNYEFTTTDGTRKMIFPNLKIQNLSIKYIMASFSEHPAFETREKSKLYGNLTFGFVRNRFSYLQIDPTVKKISLFSDGSEEKKHIEQIKKFYNYQLKKICNEKGYDYIPEE